MRYLRQTFKALSPAIVLIPVLCGIVSAQSGLTTIQDTLFDADGARYNGALTIQWSTFDTTNPGTIVQQSKTVQVVNGNLLVQLASNNTATPPANVYNVLYESDGDQQYSETWSVPVSATPLKVAQVRIGGGTGGSGGGSVGGLTGGTGATESSITNLVSDLNARPIKGPGYGTNAVAVVDQNGQIETAVGNLGDCVFVDGTTGPCSAGITLPTFINGETPGGAINGLNPTFTLANTPSGTSLLLFRNGLLAQAGADYTLSGSTITFANAAIPQSADTLLASYRIDPGATSSGSGVATGPSGSPGVNGCGAVNAVSRNAAYQIVPADNGTLFIQTANATFSLPVTPPAAGWCVALLNASGSGVSVGNSGNKINGATAAYPLQTANSVFVISDGTGYWVSGGNGANGTNGAPGAQGPAGSSGVAPSGTGAVQVTNGVAGLVSGSATNCVLVNGTSATCSGAPGGTNGQIQYNNSGSFAGFTPAVNGAGISTPSTLNFVNAAAFNGLTLGFSNPTGGSVQLGASGTLNNAGLTNSSFTTTLPSWFTGTSPVSLGGTLTVAAATGQTSHQVIGTCGATTSFSPCSLTAGDIPALSYEPTIGTGTPSQYWRGDKTWQTLNAAAVTNAVDQTGSYSNPSWISSFAWAKLTGIPVTFAPSAHAASHQNGGSDEIATATPGANAIPKAGAGGTLAVGWIPTLNQNTTGTAANVTGIVARANGGLNSAAAGSGLLRDGATPSASELTGDAVTSGSNVVTVGKVNSVSYPASPSTNSVPVVTAANTVTYEAVPNSALANSTMTVNGTSCALGAACTLGNLVAAFTYINVTLAANASNGLYSNILGVLAPNASESLRQSVVPAGTIKKLIVSFSSANIGAGDTFTVTLRRNGASTSISCTVAASGQTCSDTSDSIVTSDGDLLDYLIATTGSSLPASVAMSISLSMAS